LDFGLKQNSVTVISGDAVVENNVCV